MLKRLTLIKKTILLLSLLLLNGPTLAEKASQLESELKLLANSIVENSVTAEKKAIAVLPFPNTNGTCTELSNYLVDELTNYMFQSAVGKVEIVERSQMDAIFSEIGNDSLDPESLKKLGNVSGVEGLVIGKLTTIGNDLRINARIIATDSGKIFSSAAVSIARTAGVDELLSRSVRGGQTCGMNARSRGGRSKQVATMPVNNMRTMAPAMHNSTRPESAPHKKYKMGDFEFEGKMVKYEKDSVKAFVSITSKKKKTGLLVMTPSPRLVDANYNSIKGHVYSGVPYCKNTDPSRCRGSAVFISPNVPYTFVFEFPLKDIKTEMNAATSNVSFSYAYGSDYSWGKGSLTIENILTSGSYVR